VADITTTKSPPKGKAPGHEMEAVLGFGVVTGIALAIIGGSLYHLTKRR